MDDPAAADADVERYGLGFVGANPSGMDGSSGVFIAVVSEVLVALAGVEEAAPSSVSDKLLRSRPSTAGGGSSFSL